MDYLLQIRENIDNLRQLEFGLIQLLAYGMIVCGVFVFVLLRWFKAAYGRYSSSSWGFGLPSRLAWLVQELPSLLVPIYCALYMDGVQLKHIPNKIILGVFVVHYVQRALIYPLLIKGGKPTPFIPFALAFLFCLYNGYMQGRYITRYAQYPEDWIVQPNFVAGVALFFTGMAINIHSDHILRNLRKPGETGYKIPRGGFFEYVSGANFFGECVEWSGFALAAWSLPALAFTFFTITNIGPRACQHHMWYLQKFKEDYPKNRKAFIPFVI